MVRSTATARSPQRKGRCIRVKLACKMTRGPPRLHSPAFSRPSGVNRERRRPLGTRRNAHLARGQTRKLTIKTGFARKVGRESRGIERGSSLALGPVLIQTLRNNARSSLRAWRSETATHLHPLLPPTASTVAANAAAARASSLRLRRNETATHPEPLLLPQARALLPRYTRARRPWARKKRKMTSPRPST